MMNAQVHQHGESATDAGTSATAARVRLREALRSVTLGKFEIYDELGHGGMATVFLGYDINLARHVAIKVMAPSLLLEEGMWERFQREARIAASLSHPHIVPVYAVGDTSDLAYFIMKYVDGQSLDALIREHAPLPIDLVQLIVSQVGQALSHAHSRAIVHRDVKPANILIDSDGSAIVTDFGIARSTGLSGLTATGASVGTPYYMSPEQCSRGQVSGLADQYSLGIVAYQMITGRVPFLGHDASEVMQAHIMDTPPGILELRPDCPPAIAGVVARMLSKKGADRWPSLDDAIAALQAGTSDPAGRTRSRLAALAQSGTQRPVLPSPPQSPTPISRRGSIPTTPATPGEAAPTGSKFLRRALLGLAGVAIVAGIWALTQLTRTPTATPQPLANSDSVAMQQERVPAPSPVKIAGPPPVAAARSAVGADAQKPRVQTPSAVNSAPTLRAESSLPGTSIPKDTSAMPAGSANPAPVPDWVWVSLGTRHPSAFLYINGRWWRVPSGHATFSLKAEGCTDWDTTLVLSRDSVMIGRRSPNCQQP